MFWRIKSSTTSGIVRSAPVTARLLDGATLPSSLIRARNVFTSLSARNAALSCIFKPKKFLLSIVLLLPSFPVLLSGSPGALLSVSFSSASNPSISSWSRFFSPSWASFSDSNFSTSSETAVSSSSVSASLMAVSNSASLFSNSPSFSLKAASSLAFFSMLLRSIIAFNAMFILLSGAFSYLRANLPVSFPVPVYISPWPLPDAAGFWQICW